VPRLPDHPEDARGPRVFAYMTDDESRWLSPTERDDIALALRAAFAQASGVEGAGWATLAAADAESPRPLPTCSMPTSSSRTRL
jgi:hypothetical protein